MNTFSKVLLGTLAGAAAGYMVGILYAPDEGSQTRKKISQKKSDLEEEIKSKVNSFREEIMDQFESLKDNVADLAHMKRKKLAKEL